MASASNTNGALLSVREGEEEEGGEREKGWSLERSLVENPPHSVCTKAVRMTMRRVAK